MAEEDSVSKSFLRRHWEGYKEFWGERFSFLDNYSRFIKRDKPLPSWSEADVEEFIASEPVHGPTVCIHIQFGIKISFFLIFMLFGCFSYLGFH